MRLYCILLACLFFAPLSPHAQSDVPEPRHEHTVHAFIAAFNAQDSSAMAALVTDDVQWLSVNGDSIAVETSGKAGLVSAMDRYFQSCPTCRSEPVTIIASRDRVGAVETASWQGRDGSPKSQSGVSVYEFSGGLIRRVYYFPAER